MGILSTIFERMDNNRDAKRGELKLLREAAIQESARLHSRQRAAAERIDDLEAEVGELALLTRSLLQLLVRNGVITMEDLSGVMQKLDVEDGVEDGMVTPESAKPPPPKAPVVAPKARRKRP